MERSLTAGLSTVVFSSSAVISLKVGTSLAYHRDTVLLTPKGQTAPLVKVGLFFMLNNSDCL